MFKITREYDSNKLKLIEDRIGKSGILKKKGEDRKTTEGVIDTSTLMNLFSLIKKGTIFEVDGIISTGKEANVYHGIDKEKKSIAIKIYRTSTADYKKMKDYILGDERFQRVRHTTRHFVYAWALKEYKNLLKMEYARVNVPHPIAVKGNVLVMSFIGEDKKAAPLLKNSIVEDPKKLFKTLLSTIKLLYQKAKLVHADFSEYNILWWEKPYIIDVSQSVLINHPMAMEFLERDVNNLKRFFKKLRVETPTIEEMMDTITGKGGTENE
ncbi:MAG: serine protein kinase RIO [Candidatus Ranarchaeia archaeon]